MYFVYLAAVVYDPVICHIYNHYKIASVIHNTTEAIYFFFSLLISLMKKSGTLLQE